MQPIFITSLPKSGSTLLADLLDGHPDIVSLPDEPPVFRLASSPADKWDVSSVQEAYERLQQYTKYRVARNAPRLQSQADALGRLQQSFAAAAPSASLEGLYAGLAAAFASAFMAETGRARLYSIKNVGNPHAHAFLDAFRNSKIVHLVRHPCAFYLSRLNFDRLKRRKHYFFDPGNWLYQWTIAHDWLAFEQRVAEAAKGPHGDRIMTIRYEDLVQRPRTVMTEVAQFLCIPFDDRLLYPSKLGQRQATATSVTSDADGTEIYTASVDKWKVELAPSTVDLLVSITSPIAARYYPESTDAFKCKALKAIAPIFSMAAKLSITVLERSFAPRLRATVWLRCPSHTFKMNAWEYRKFDGLCPYCGRVATRIADAERFHQVEASP